MELQEGRRLGRVRGFVGCSAEWVELHRGTFAEDQAGPMEPEVVGEARRKSRQSRLRMWQCNTTDEITTEALSHVSLTSSAMT